MPGLRIFRGYRQVLMPDWPGASPSGHVWEHRLVKELELGRTLEPFEVIHHVNGDPLDNRPENLEVMVKDEHGLLHADLRRKALVTYDRHMPYRKTKTDPSEVSRLRSIAGKKGAEASKKFWESLTPQERTERARKARLARVEAPEGPSRREGRSNDPGAIDMANAL